MRRSIRALTAVLAVVAMATLCTAFYVGGSLPDRFYITEGMQFSVASFDQIVPVEIGKSDIQMAAATQGNTFDVELKIFGAVAVKPVRVEVVSEQMLAPGGMAFGIKMFTQGVMVVGLTDIETNMGSSNPAKQAGIELGDIILKIDGEQVDTNEDVQEHILSSGGAGLTVEYLHDGQARTTVITPVQSVTSSGYKAGMWVRDSSAGIGTVTYIDPVGRTFAGLGHAVCDVDTGEILPLMSGEAVGARITGAVQGTAGTPGELCGTFLETTQLGQLYKNCETGIYGVLDGAVTPQELIPVGHRQEVETGAAQIITTIEGTTPQMFDITIEKVDLTDGSPTKNMVIHITDQALLQKTGGIVQGMSGSPIIQNGKLIGAVTHVFVNDPTRGYGIFVENMLENAENTQDLRQMAG